MVNHHFVQHHLGDYNLGAGGFKHFFIFTPKIVEMIQFDLRIFFKWVVQPPTRLHL